MPKTVRDTGSQAKKKKATKNKPPTPPVKYATHEAVMKVANKYFDLCTKNKQLPSKAGLLYALDISRDTYSRYRKQEALSDTIRQLDAYIEQAWVGRLNGQGATGAIFYLKNAFKEDYKDRVETDVTTKGESLNEGVSKLLAKAYGG